MAIFRAAMVAIALLLPIALAPHADASGWRKICAYENKVVVCKVVRR
jgi:hypothetical protein